MRVEHRPWAGATATLGLPAALLTLLGPGTARRVADLADAATDADLLAGAAALAVTAISAWLLLLTVLTALASVTRSRRRWARVVRDLTPRRYRAAVAVLLGATLLGSPATAQADLDGTETGPTRPVATGLRLPDLPGTPPGRSDRPTRPRQPEARRTVVVRQGDTLWSIARASLAPSDHSDRATARAVHRWYAANRRAVGPDPDLILPGTPLDPPDHAAPTTDRSTR